MEPQGGGEDKRVGAERRPSNKVKQRGQDPPPLPPPNCIYCGATLIPHATLLAGTYQRRKEQFEPHPEGGCTSIWCAGWHRLDAPEEDSGRILRPPAPMEASMGTIDRMHTAQRCSVQLLNARRLPDAIARDSKLYIIIGVTQYCMGWCRGGGGGSRGCDK